MYLTLPMWLAFVTGVPSWRRPVQVLALILMSTGLIASSFASTVPQLIATQGVMYGDRWANHLCVSDIIHRRVVC